MVFATSDSDAAKKPRLRLMAPRSASVRPVGDFHSGGGRLVFGLWATYSIAASRLIDSALACAMQRFVPITAAGQRRILTGFPFINPSRESLTCTRSAYTAMPLSGRGHPASFHPFPLHRGETRPGAP